MALRTIPRLGLVLAIAAGGLAACSWYENLTGQTAAASAPPQGAANFNNMMAAIDNEPDESRQLSNLSDIRPDTVIVANADMMARGSSGRQLDQAMHQNARSIEDLRHQVAQNPPLKRVLRSRNVPVNNVVALDVTDNGGVVVYALPTVQSGAVPPPANTTRPADPNAPPPANAPDNAGATPNASPQQGVNGQ